MANIALDIGGRLQLDASGFNGAPYATANDQLFRKEIAVNARATAYVHGRAAHLPLNTAEDFHCPVANNFSDNGRALTDGGDPPVGSEFAASCTMAVFDDRVIAWASAAF